MEERPSRAALRGEEGAFRPRKTHANTATPKSPLATAAPRPAESSVEDVILNGGKAAVRDPT